MRIKLGIMEFNTAKATVAMIFFLVVLAIALNGVVAYLVFLLSRWAILEIFTYKITGWQFIAACVLLGIVSSFFKRSKE